MGEMIKIRSLLILLLPILTWPDVYSSISQFSDVVNAIYSKCESHRIVAIGERHWGELDHELRMAIISDPRFSKSIDIVFVEFANSLYQEVLDEYVLGGNLSLDQVSIVWKNTTQLGTWETPIYGQLIKEIRDINMDLHDSLKVRVLAGGLPVDWNNMKDGKDYYEQKSSWPADRGSFPAIIADEEIFKKNKKAIAFFGHGQIDKNSGQWVEEINAKYPGQTYSIGTVRSFFGDNNYFEVLSPTDPILLELKGHKSEGFPARDFFAFKHGGALSDMLDAVICFGSLEDTRSDMPEISSKWESELIRRRQIRSELWQIEDSIQIYAQDDISFDFNTKGELDSWNRFYQVEGWPDMMKSIRIEDGKLILEPYTCGWYADYHAPFLYHEVEGDFEVTTKVEIKGVHGERPESAWSLSGLMIRAPRNDNSHTWKPGGENWLFLTTGIANDLDQPVFETKTTINSKSALRLHPNKMEPVELKIRRAGNEFVLSYRYPSEEWKEIERFHHPHMPRTVQAGINAYTDFYGASDELRSDYKKYNMTVLDVNPDLRAEYEYFRIEY
ncbi:MAG: hypothetical protein AAGC47_04975 [Bacteroidota bacterium]